MRDGQSFLSLYYEPGAVEIATGEIEGEKRREGWVAKKSLGQIETPPEIADLMARWVMSARPASVLDPAAGLGALLEACRRCHDAANLVGIERDAETLQRAKRLAPGGAKLILADYLTADTGQFGGIIANPPYVKAQRLGYTEANWRYFEECFGTPLNRLTNIYALFLLKIWEDLAVGGRAAVLLPAEFLNANFGDEIKERLLRVIRPVGIAVFASTVNLFPGALTTSAIILLEKGRLALASIRAKKVVSVGEAAAFVQDLLEPANKKISMDEADLATLHPGEKWLNALLNEKVSPGASGLPKRVGDYFACRRGIATGANDFFCLSGSALRERGLHLGHVEPCVTKATDAAGFVFTPEKFAALVAADRRCYLLNPREDGRSLNDYLSLGERLDIPRRHLPSHRPIWYRPENRPVADVWVAVFSRENVKFILNTSGAKNLTCFHGLYAKPGYETLAPLLTLFLNSSMGRESFARVNRFYGDGLNKLEPKDVEAMPCADFPELSQRGADKLVERLGELESLPRDARTEEADQIVAEYLNIPGVVQAWPVSG